jgi:RHS repeat-associated protein
MIYNSWNSAQPNISFTDLFDAWSGLGDTSLILDVLQNHYSNDAHLRILLKEVRALQQLYQLASSSNYSSFVSNSINATSYQDLSFVMYQSSALTFSSYLKLVRTHFGTTNYSSMMSDIGELLKFGKDITWQEQHIYGSSRLGMYQSNQLLVKYKYKYSDTLQIYLDSVKFDRDTNRAMRKLSHKQYELTNHLGNVLSTVLDRKTPITATGGSGSSTTITHYEGDVVFATDYYPFGSPMSWSTPDSSGGRMNSGVGYRYGFNNQEKEPELGDYYAFEYRIHDARLGRFLSVDPLASEFPHMSPYAAFNDNPIKYNDPTGAAPEDPIGPGYYQANVNSRMIAFGVRHPIAAASIGTPSKGCTNISTNSVRFSTRIGLNENAQHAGSQVNAFRHVLWQAEITQEFGTSIAKQVGNLHEENAFAANGSNFKTSFNTLSKADETIDLMNNVIGRSIGAANPNANMQELALKTLDYYKENGLWTASPVTNDRGKVTGYNISQSKLSQEQYDAAKGIIQGLNGNGFTQSEQQKRDADTQKKIDRINRGPKF